MPRQLGPFSTTPPPFLTRPSLIASRRRFSSPLPPSVSPNPPDMTVMAAAFSLSMICSSSSADFSLAGMVNTAMSTFAGMSSMVGKALQPSISSASGWRRKMLSLPILPPSMMFLRMIRPVFILPAEAPMISTLSGSRSLPMPLCGGWSVSDFESDIFIKASRGTISPPPVIWRGLISSSSIVTGEGERGENLSPSAARALIAARRLSLSIMGSEEILVRPVTTG